MQLKKIVDGVDFVENGLNETIKKTQALSEQVILNIFLIDITLKVMN